ncbi:MAG: glycosyltransferase [Lachnospiraceae bacterium]|nr:glycosyltransferase [Lachnospiraceae bacterium]
MKKILFVTTISGFLPQFELNDVKLVQKLGYEVHYASNFNIPIYAFDRKDLMDKGIILHHIEIRKSPFKFINNLSAIRQLVRIIDKEHINLIHCHNPMGAMAARFAAHISQTKPYVIYTAHGFHFYKGAPLLNWMLYYPAEKIAAHWSDVIVTINKEDYRRAKDKFRLKKDGYITQIHSVGIDREKFKSRPDLGVKKRRELNIPEDAFHIVTAAELNKNKNQTTVINAIAKCKYEDVYYSICGKGPEKANLKALIKEKKLAKRVRLLGYRTDIDEVLQTANVFAFPSKREGLGVAAVEALSSGVPLIVADNRGTREYSVNNFNSIVCSCENIDDFKNAIEKLHEDKDFLNKLRSNCRNSAKPFGTEETMNIMREVYKEADKKINERLTER